MRYGIEQVRSIIKRFRYGHAVSGQRNRTGKKINPAMTLPQDPPRHRNDLARDVSVRHDAAYVKACQKRLQRNELARFITGNSVSDWSH